MRYIVDGMYLEIEVPQQGFLQRTTTTSSAATSS